jgi:hypothetical protein
MIEEKSWALDASELLEENPNFEQEKAAIIMNTHMKHTIVFFIGPSIMYY